MDAPSLKTDPLKVSIFFIILKASSIVLDLKNILEKVINKNVMKICENKYIRGNLLIPIKYLGCCLQE